MRRIEEFRDLKDAELTTELGNMRDELFRLRFKHATGQLDNSSRLGRVRKDIARVETLLRERELNATASGESAEHAKSITNKGAK